MMELKIKFSNKWLCQSHNLMGCPELVDGGFGVESMQILFEIYTPRNLFPTP